MARATASEDVPRLMGLRSHRKGRAKLRLNGVKAFPSGSWALNQLARLAKALRQRLLEGLGLKAAQSSALHPVLFKSPPHGLQHACIGLLLASKRDLLKGPGRVSPSWPLNHYTKGLQGPASKMSCIASLGKATNTATMWLVSYR